MIKCKSIYAKPAPDDGLRVLVDRLWPEGISTREAAVAWWAQELAPSYDLWRYGYEVNRWDSYRDSYLRELAAGDRQPSLTQLRQRAANGVLTLLYGTSDPIRNNAVILREYVENSGGDARRVQAEQ